MRLVTLCALALLAAPAWGHGHDHHDHAMHHHATAGPATPAYAARMARYELPDVVLQDAQGRDVTFKTLVAGGKPVVLDFIYTSCTAVCPVQSATVSQARQRLRDQGERPMLVSVSIDPEHDTPERLREYATRYGADEDDWIFLTGTPANVRRVQGAFDAYRGDKMNHKPVTFIRRGGASDWMRLDGFTGASDLVREYRRLVQ